MRKIGFFLYSLYSLLLQYLHQIIELFHLIFFFKWLKEKEKKKINRYPNVIKRTHVFCWFVFSKYYRFMLNWSRCEYLTISFKLVFFMLLFFFVWFHADLIVLRIFLCVCFFFSGERVWWRMDQFLFPY